MQRYKNQDHSMLAGHHAALTLLGRKDLDPWEVNTERSYYEEQVLTPDKKHEGTDILVSEKAPPHAGFEVQTVKGADLASADDCRRYGFSPSIALFYCQKIKP